MGLQLSFDDVWALGLGFIWVVPKIRVPCGYPYILGAVM